MTGREKCQMAKRGRIAIAKEFGIEGFEVKPCEFDGECDGHCPACDEEALFIENIIAAKEKELNIERIDTSKAEWKDRATRGKIKEPEATMGVITPDYWHEDLELKKWIEDDTDKRPRGLRKIHKKPKRDEK